MMEQSLQIIIISLQGKLFSLREYGHRIYKPRTTDL